MLEVLFWIALFVVSALLVFITIDRQKIEAMKKWKMYTIAWIRILSMIGFIWSIVGLIRLFLKFLFEIL